MATKLGKSALPAGHNRDSFKAFGPVVTKDTEWGNACLADLGCFNQEKADSNKYYHLAVVLSTVNNKWYAYFEWGRTKPDGRSDKPQYQFIECSSKEEAQRECADQFAEKNTKRGMWEKIGSKDRYVSKPGKDCYVVRVTATRLVGLPCAGNIANEDAKGVAALTAAAPAKKATKKAEGRKVDRQTHKLFADLIGGAVKYTNAVMTGGKGGPATIPAQAALEEGREVLDDAMKRLKVVGDDLAAQKADAQLKKLTYHLYGIIPKAKPAGLAESEWLLTKDNVLAWRQDIDAFETALQAQDIDVEEESTDVMQGIPADVKWIDPSDDKHKWLSKWWIGATRNRHGHIGKLTVHNLWEISRHGDLEIMRDAQEETLGQMPKDKSGAFAKIERPLHQDDRRPDLNVAERKLFHDTNTALMFHGTRSVNVPGIVRENLRFPKELTGVIISGAMFGPGSYFADDFKKSAGYCSNPNPRSHSYYGGGGEVAGRHAFMFAFDVIVGNPCVAPGAHGYAGPPKGHHSVFGKAGHTTSWGGTLMNNEWIIYRKGRIEMKYLAELEW